MKLNSVEKMAFTCTFSGKMLSLKRRNELQFGLDWVLLL